MSTFVDGIQAKLYIPDTLSEALQKLSQILSCKGVDDPNLLFNYGGRTKKYYCQTSFDYVTNTLHRTFRSYNCHGHYQKPKRWVANENHVCIECRDIGRMLQGQFQRKCKAYFTVPNRHTRLSSLSKKQLRDRLKQERKEHKGAEARFVKVKKWLEQDGRPIPKYVMDLFPKEATMTEDNENHENDSTNGDGDKEDENESDDGGVPETSKTPELLGLDQSETLNTLSILYEMSSDEDEL